MAAKAKQAIPMAKLTILTTDCKRYFSNCRQARVRLFFILLLFYVIYSFAIQFIFNILQFPGNPVLGNSRFSTRKRKFLTEGTAVSLLGNESSP